MSIEWKQFMAVGDVTIDHQHQRLLDQINVLLEACERGAGKEVIGEIVGFLETYISDHLAFEEEHMRKHKYPDFDAHKALHDGFVAKYQDFKERLLSEPSVALVVEVQTFLGGWWVDHIGTEDQKYADYIEAHEESHPVGEAEDFHEVDQTE